MREALNENPLVQLGVVGVLLVVVAVFLMSSGGGGGEEEEGESATATTTATATTPDGGSVSVTAEVEATAPAGGAGSLSAALSPQDAPQIAAPPLPHPVLRAWRANQTLVVLFVRDGGIDDRLVRSATVGLAGFRDAAVFIVPAKRIARYAALAEGVGVDRVPALVVVTPRHLKKTIPTASVSYGFQSPQSVAQAVIDAGYRGKTLDYHP
jgi:hypothetical protein